MAWLSCIGSVGASNAVRGRPAGASIGLFEGSALIGKAIELADHFVKPIGRDPTKLQPHVVSCHGAAAQALKGLHHFVLRNRPHRSASTNAAPRVGGAL
jgi:hypothetical protein